MTKRAELENKDSAIGVVEQSNTEHMNTQFVKDVYRGAVVPEKRPDRKFSTTRGALHEPKIPGFRCYLANYYGLAEEQGRDYLLLLDKGYTPVLRKELDPDLDRSDPSLANSPIIVPTGENSGGTKKGIWLKIPQAWWDDDYEKDCKANDKRTSHMSEETRESLSKLNEAGAKSLQQKVTTSTIFGNLNPSDII